MAASGSFKVSPRPRPSSKRCSLSDLRTMGGVAVFVAVCICVTVVCVTAGRSPSPDTSPSFRTDGDMLEYLMDISQINRSDGLLVTWYHRANKKSELTEAMQSDAMVLEADVNIEGLYTPNETETPIMAHFPDIYSDNTLQEWLDTVLTSTKGIKLDFKSIKAVGPSLDVLVKKSSQIKRPVWINADIMNGPNVFLNIAVNASRFLDLIQRKYPNVTISPGWMTLYLPVLSNKTYTWEMIWGMYDLVKDLPQRITFPVRAVMIKPAWQYFNWLLQQSDRYSLTLWQGELDPITVEDLLYVRDNSRAEEIYYDIYEPVLSQFKEAAFKSNRRRLFYTGGNLLQYFYPEESDGLLVNWYESVAVLLCFTERMGMLVLEIGAENINGTLIPVVYLSPLAEASDLLLEHCLELIYSCRNSWGVFLRIKTAAALSPVLHLLSKLRGRNLLWNPIWINMVVSFGRFNTSGYMPGEEFLTTINSIFPFVTIAPSWPKEALDGGYTSPLVEDMLSLCNGLWQEVSFQLQAAVLAETWNATIKLLEESAMYTLTLEHNHVQGSFSDGYQGLMSVRAHSDERVYYNLPIDYRQAFMANIFSSQKHSP
ncbi:protein FAM151A [Microcaecilia unicolor]|uniref:Protein FAM151A n=1 Tax=Microcaecilia unicolor TaxID=1415580 RepID=A0A6P7YF80_9AMPH|nr:protein FAM151A [Microcaecilia unicolor]